MNLMNEFIKYIWQLIIITSNATFKVPSLCPVNAKTKFDDVG